MGWSLIIVISLQLLTGMLIVIWFLLRDIRLILIWIYIRINCPKPKEKEEPPKPKKKLEIVYYEPTTCLVAGEAHKMINQNKEQIKDEDDEWKHQFKPSEI
jgi:flagellar basal body-associated protein FliL